MEIIRTRGARQTSLSPPHRVTLGVSRWLAGAMVAGHGAVMAALPAARPDLAAWMIGLLWPCLACSLYRTLSRHACRKAPGAVIRVEADAHGRWFVLRRDGSHSPVTLLGSSTIHPWVVVLNVRYPQGAGRRRWPRSVIIPRDACDPAAFRRLRVWLRWGHEPDSDREAPGR